MKQKQTEQSIQQTIDFLEEIYGEIAEFQRISRKNELHDANRFNPFRFINTDEKELSAIIAFLLDPKKEHGQGDLLLNSFLKKLGLYQFLGYQTAKVTVEKSTDKNRYHDIFIEGFIGQKLVWVLSLENKLQGAEDQNNQISDYLKNLESYDVPFCLCYLPIYACDPDTKSIGEKEREQYKKVGKLKILDADGLIEWLDDTPVIAPQINSFVQFFITFLKEEMMGETKETDLLTEQIINHQEYLESALHVIAAEQNIRKELWNTLFEQIEEKVTSKYRRLVREGWEMCDEFEPSKVGMQLGFCLPGGDGDDFADAGVYLTFYAKNYQKCCLEGWVVEEQYEKYSDKLIDELNQLKGNSKRKEGSERYRLKLDGDLYNWQPSTWLRIPTGELADEIFEKWQPLLDIFEKNLK